MASPSFFNRTLGITLAACTVMVAGAIGVASVFRPVPLFAAQAALDHLKCVRIGPSAASPDARALEASWREWQGWDLHVPTGEAGAGLRLLGYRRCVLTEGKMAHVLYDRGGSVVSLFVMPAGVDRGATVAHAELEMFGQDAVLWESHGLTYALVGRGDRAAMATVSASLEREVNARAASTIQAFSWVLVKRGVSRSRSRTALARMSCARSAPISAPSASRAALSRRRDP